MANTEPMNPVRAARLAQNLTREGLAFRAGVTVRTVERIEAAAVTPHRVTRRAIAAALNTTTAELWPDIKEAA